MLNQGSELFAGLVSAHREAARNTRVHADGLIFQ